MQRSVSLASELNDLYRTGMTVNAISAFTGLSEDAIVKRLCAAARMRRSRNPLDVLAPDTFRVRWDFVSWRN